MARKRKLKHQPANPTVAQETPAITETIELAIESIRKVIADLREERDIYRHGLESIAKQDSEVDAKVVALLYLGRVKVQV